MTHATNRQRQPPEVRRRMLLAAARQVITERGLSATTVRDVAAAGNVAVGTVTYHFTGMAEVLAGVLQADLDSYSTEVYDAARAAATGRAGIEILIDGLLASGPRARDHWRLWLDFWALAAHQSDYAAWQARVYRDLHALVEQLLARGRTDGSLPAGPADHPGSTDAARAIGFVALMDGLVVQAYLPHPRVSPRRARELLRAQLIPT